MYVEISCILFVYALTPRTLMMTTTTTATTTTTTMAIIRLLYTPLFRHKDSENKPNNKTKLTKTTTQK